MRILNSFIDAYSSIWYGIITAVILVVLLFFSINAIQSDKRFSPLSYIMGVVLAAFLSFQFTFLIGAIMFKSDCTDIASIINDLVPNQELTLNTQDIRSSLRELEREAPFIKNFFDVDAIDESLPDGAVGDALLDKVHSYLNWYIFRRVLWSLLACALLGFGIIYTMERSPRGRTRKTPGYRSSGQRRHNNDDF